MKITRDRLGLIFVWLFVLLMLGLWLLASPLSYRFQSANQTLTSLGQISGLVGYLLLCFVIVLDGRFRFLEPYFSGMNRMYISHHKLGGVSFCLILVHPLFLTIKYLLISTRSAALFLIPGEDIYIATGIYALLFLTLLLVFTFYTKLPYHIWKASHSLLSLVFFLSIFHSFFITSDLLANIPLKLYVGFFTLAGVIATAYLFLMKTNVLNKARYKVAAINKLSDVVSEIALEPLGAGISYLPGQFVFVNFKSKHISVEAHPFSITSSPDEKNLTIIVKVLGDYTANIHNIQVGDQAFVEGPYGYFSTERYPNKYQLWIGGGIGITPFLSMASSLDSNNLDVYLYYSALDQKGLIGAEKLEEIARRNKNFHLTYFLFNEKGLLTADVLKRDVPDLLKREVFICGPVPMMEALRKQLVAIGMNDHSIHTEEFSW